MNCIWWKTQISLFPQVVTSSVHLSVCPQLRSMLSSSNIVKVWKFSLQINLLNSATKSILNTTDQFTIVCQWFAVVISKATLSCNCIGLMLTVLPVILVINVHSDDQSNDWLYLDDWFYLIGLFQSLKIQISQISQAILLS